MFVRLSDWKVDTTYSRSQYSKFLTPTHPGNTRVGGVVEMRVSRKSAAHSSSTRSRNDSIAISEEKKEDIIYEVSGSVQIAIHISAASTRFSSWEAGMSLASGMVKMNVLLERLNGKELKSRSISR